MVYTSDNGKFFSVDIDIAALSETWHHLPSDRGMCIVFYDNSPPEVDVNRIKYGWGLSVGFNIGNKTRILFDCGWSGPELLMNLEYFAISPYEFDKIVISHRHWDHTGGLPDIIAVNGNSEVYLPTDFSSRYLSEIAARSSAVYRIGPGSDIEGPFRIAENVYVTGTVDGGGKIGEQALIISTSDNYGILVVGCSHPGIRPFIEKTAGVTDVRMILGGLHGFKDRSYLERIRIERLSVGHCTVHKEYLSKGKYIYKDIHTGYAFVFGPL